MKDPTTAPTAELLAEINRIGLDCEQYIHRVAHGLDTDVDAGKYRENVEKISAIAAELDRRCSEAGIQLHVDGMVSFSKFGDKTDDMVCPRIYATELRDLLTWLLLKGGK